MLNDLDVCVTGFPAARSRRIIMTVSRSLKGKCAVLKISGRIDTITAPKLEKEIREVFESFKEIVLDFSELDYISSAGLRVLVAIQKSLDNDHTMTITSCSDDILDIFEITGFIDVFTIK